MSEKFEPSGHKLPYSRGRLLASGLTYPENRLATQRVLFVLLVIPSIFAFALGGSLGSLSASFAFAAAAIFFPFGFVRFFDFVRSRTDPEAARLARNHEGRSLLDAGEELRLRRARLEEDLRSSRPLIRDGGKGAWDEQLSLERELRARQERHLANP